MIRLGIWSLLWVQNWLQPWRGIRTFWSLTWFCSFQRLLQQRQLYQVASKSERIAQDGYSPSSATSNYPLTSAPASAVADPTASPMPLEEFSRRLKELAPNINVQPTSISQRPAYSSIYPEIYQRPSNSQMNARNSQVGVVCELK